MAANTNPIFVIDASYLLSFLLPDEFSTEIQTFFKHHSETEIDLVSTRLLPFEVVNGLNNAVLRKRINPKTAKMLINRFLQMKIDLVEIDLNRSFILARKNNLTIYDASYLQLSYEQNLPLFSLDKKLQELVN